MKTLKIQILILFFYSINSYAVAQKSIVKQFLDIHYPEQIWVLFHPFVAKEALAIAHNARAVSTEMRNDPDLDGDYSGGQVDAFRHAYWMATLGAAIGERKARWLGKAHEKGNKIDFAKSKLEEGALPDFKMSEMDLANNEVGLRLARQHKNYNDEQFKVLVKERVIAGEMFIVKKNAKGQFLNSKGKIISEDEYYRLWHTPKKLVPSNFIRPDTEEN